MQELEKQNQSGNAAEPSESTTKELFEKEEKRVCKEIEIEDCLVRALQSFEQDECTWGVSLTHLQWAVFVSQKIKAQVVAHPNTALKPSVKNLRSKFGKGKTIDSQEMTNMFVDTRLREELNSLHK